MKLLKHKGYFGDIQISVEAEILHGKLQFISALVTYEGGTVDELIQAFNEAVDDYLETCKTLGYEPEIPCKGSFNVRVGHEIHLAAIVKAKEVGVSLNELVKVSLKEKLSESAVI